MEPARRRLAHLSRARSGLCVQSGEGRIVATTATLPYGTRFAWISMVLVAGEYRRRGLATRLMRRAMEDLDAMGLIAILDATPDGRAVYRNLGFQDSWGFQRFIGRKPQRVGTTSPPPDIRVRPLTDADWPALCALRRRGLRRRARRHAGRPARTIARRRARRRARGRHRRLPARPRRHASGHICVR